MYRGIKRRTLGSGTALYDLGVLFNTDDGSGGGAATQPKGKPDAPTLTHSQSLNRMGEITGELERLQELDHLSNDDEAYFAELTSEFAVVDNHRKRLEREAKIEAVRKAGQTANARNMRPGAAVPGQQQTPGAAGDGYDLDAFAEPDSVVNGRFRNPWDLSNIRSFGRSREDLNTELQSRARSAIDQMPGATDAIREAATGIIEQFDDKDAKISKLVLAASSPEYLRAFSKMATNKEHLLEEPERRAMDYVRAMSLTDSAGGYLVPFQMDPTVILTANGSRNDIRRRARTVVATGDTWNGVTSGAVSWSWDAEATVVSDDAPTLASPAIPIYKANGFVPISIEALEDANNIAATVGTLLAEGREVLEAAAFVVGTGTGQPKGIVTALTGTGSVINSATTDTLAVGDLYSLQGALPARYRGNAAWLANNLFYNRARQFDTAGGSALWAQLGADRPPLLLGKDVLEAEDMDGVINATQENYMAVFGDFTNYVIADRIGMTVEFIPHLFGSGVAGGSIATNPTPTTFRPTGQRGWYAYYRVGADVVNNAAFRMLNVT
jgi:HK97 family phage major capsid protein